MDMFRRLYSGKFRYLSNSTIHPFSSIGGKRPVTFQSVIDSPDLVNLVDPPTITIPNTMPEHPKSQEARPRNGMVVADVVAAVAVVVATCGNAVRVDLLLCRRMLPVFRRMALFRSAVT